MDDQGGSARSYTGPLLIKPNIAQILLENLITILWNNLAWQKNGGLFNDELVSDERFVCLSTSLQEL